MHQINLTDRRFDYLVKHIKGKRMEFANYEQLVEYIKSFKTQNEQMREIVNYFMDNVKFDYVMLEHLNHVVSMSFAKYVDRLFPNINDKFREKAICFIRNSSNISTEYWNRIRDFYLTPTINEKGEEKYITMYEAINKVCVDLQNENGLLKKGVACHITQFAKKLCDSVGIQCLIVNGISSGKMEHSWLDVCINGEELFYDITYALYIRDNFCGMGKHYLPSEWLGITPKQLHKNQPTRTISYPKGFNLEDLGLNNSPLCMKDFFDTTA